MKFFSRKKELFDCEPGELDLVLLAHLQASLLAKLILVNEEMHNRYRKVLDSGESGNSRKVLADGAHSLASFNKYLENELARITGKREDLAGLTIKAILPEES